MCNSGNLGILLGYSFSSINNDDHHIRAFHSGNCTDNTVALNLLFDLVFLSKTCGIDENIFISIVHDRGIDRIARRSGDIRYNRLFLSGQQIQKRRFSGIRLSKNNCLDALLDHLTLIRRCQELFNLLFLLRNNHGQPLRVSVQTDVLRVIKRRLDKRDLINQLLANCPDRLFHRSAQLALGAF